MVGNRSRIYTLGLGCERGCGDRELLSLAESVLHDAGEISGALVGIYTIEQRRHEPAILYIAEQLGLPIGCFSAEQLEAQTPRLLNPSERVFALVGCHGVAEAAALAGAGPAGRLIVGKTKSAHATAALAVRDAGRQRDQ